MSTDVEQQLVGLLQALQKLKPPGASKGKIAEITALCLSNIQYNAMIVDTLTKHFYSTPVTHKLGVLFVVDSVTRQWIEKAKQAGQALTDAAPADGSFVAGVNRMSNHVASLVKEMISRGPADQKAKVTSLVDIWRRGNTFPARIAELESICKQTSTSQVVSQTPPGSPPPALVATLGLKTTKSHQSTRQPAVAPSTAAYHLPKPPGPAPAPPTDAASILAALAGYAQPQLPGPMPIVASPPQVSPAYTGQPAQPPTQNIAALLGGLGGAGLTLPSHHTPTPLFPSVLPQAAALPQTHSPMAGFPPFGFAPPPSFPQAPVPAPAPAVASTAGLAGLEALTSLIPPGIMTDQTKLTQVLTLFQELLKAGVPQDQWRAVVEQLYPQVAPPAQPTMPTWPAGPASNQSRQGPQSTGGRRGDTSQTRRRSRSPDHYKRGSEINRRPSPVYGTYHTPGQNGSQQNNNGPSSASDYRQRSPLRNRDGDDNIPRGPRQSKWTDLDRSIPPNHIKVLSRTLFVGGANGSEAELRAIFSRFGRVQTCIVNSEKRHAFVKMYTREEAIRARTGMDGNSDPDVVSKARQTRWGVGFGPRDCCDYGTGESTIPIDRLTDADQKWVLNAEYGGTGGRPIESGLVMEEPDIEIGAGVSSKAMSRRVGPEGPSKRGGHEQYHNQNSQRGENGGMGGMGGGVGRGGHGGHGGHGAYGGQGSQAGKRGHGGRGGARGRGGRNPSPKPERPNVQPPPEVPQFGSFQMPPLGSGPPY